MRITFIALIAFFSVATFCMAVPLICDKKAPAVNCFVYNPVQGCLCTAPEVCKTDRADPCSVCNDKKIYSFEPGKNCDPKLANAHICTAMDRLRRCFVYRPVDGCICSAPGVCQKGKADPCSVCSDSKVYSFAAGVDC